jgi:hypothetical protein
MIVGSSRYLYWASNLRFPAAEQQLRSATQKEYLNYGSDSLF